MLDPLKIQRNYPSRELSDWPTCASRKLEGVYRLDAEGVGFKRVKHKSEQGESFSEWKHSPMTQRLCSRKEPRRQC